MNKKLCPLLMMTGVLRAAAALQTYGDDETSDDCLEEKCAWWNPVMGTCAVAVLALDIGMAIARRKRSG